MVHTQEHNGKGILTTVDNDSCEQTNVAHFGICFHGASIL